MYCNVQAHMKGSELLDRVFDHLNLVEKDYFGVGYQADSNKMVCRSLCCVSVVSSIYTTSVTSRL